MNKSIIVGVPKEIKNREYRAGMVPSSVYELTKYGHQVLVQKDASICKIAHGIADTLITNAVAQTLKGKTPVILYPVDQSSELVTTEGPDGIEFTISPRDVDLVNVDHLQDMKGVTILRSPSQITQVVRNHHHNKA